MTLRSKMLTQREGAEAAQVSLETFSGWLESGELKSLRIPGCQERRVRGTTLARFLREREMPLGQLEVPSVMLVGVDQELSRQLHEALKDECDISVVSEVINGHHSNGAPKKCLVLDSSIGEGTIHEIIAGLNGSSTAVVLLIQRAKECGRLNFERFLKPTNTAILTQRIRVLSGIA